MNIEKKDLLSAYSEEIRLRIAFLLDGASICVNCLVAVCELPQSTISRHLSVLRKASLIMAEKKGTNTYYRLETENGPFAKINQKLIQVYKEELQNEEPYKSDRIRLEQQLRICPVECKIA